MPLATPAPVRNLSPTFSKAALRALLAIGDESDAVFRGYVNDAKVEAESPEEFRVVNDLYSVNLFIELRQTEENIRVTAIRRAYDLATDRLGHELFWFINNDTVVQGMYQRERACRTEATSMLRSRVYQPITECSDSK